MMDYKKLISIIEKHGLKPATKRELPMLCLSVIFKAYGPLIRKELGFYYDAWGALGGENQFYSLINEDDIAGKTRKLIKDNHGDVKRFLHKAKELHADAMRDIARASKIADDDPMKALMMIMKAYPIGMTGLGIYNVFWRAVGNDNLGMLPIKVLEQISKERTEVAKFYPMTESIIQRCVLQIGTREGFDGGLLRYMTLPEMDSFLKSIKMPGKTLSTLEKRREGYFYIFVKGKEYVFTGKKALIAIKKRFYSSKGDGTKIIKGVCAYPGKASGKVMLLDRKKKQAFASGTVIVTHMTLPDDTPIVRRCAALVTDEGGLLSHAAIIARELKKPCIIATRNATKIFKDKDYVEVDADRGIVRIIEKKK
jgi:phosphohistidine swiveling domain-containing protein